MDGEKTTQANCEDWDKHEQPAPTADEVREAVREVSTVQKDCATGGYTPSRFAQAAFTLLRSHAAQAQELAGIKNWEAILNNTIELVKHGLNGPWEPNGDVAATAKDAGDALQRIGKLPCCEDWSFYSELPELVEAHIAAQAQRIGVLERQHKVAEDACQRNFHRAERAEAELCEALAAAHCHKGEFEAMAERLKGEEAASHKLKAERDALKDRVEVLEEVVEDALDNIAHSTCCPAAVNGGIERTCACDALGRYARYEAALRGAEE